MPAANCRPAMKGQIHQMLLPKLAVISSVKLPVT